MKRFFILVMLLIATSVVGFTQTATTQQTPSAPVKKSPLADYAGTWTSAFEGHPWLTIRLTSQGTALSGSVQRAHEFQFADSWPLKSVSEDQITESIDSAALQGDGLLITVKDPNAQQPNRYAAAVDRREHRRPEDGGDVDAAGNAETATVEADEGDCQRGRACSVNLV